MKLEPAANAPMWPASWKHAKRTLLVDVQQLAPDQMTIETIKPADPSAPVLLSLEDIALLLQISRTKVYDLMRTGQLRSVKVGGSRRVTATALNYFVEFLDGGEAA